MATAVPQGAMAYRARSSERLPSGGPCASANLLAAVGGRTAERTPHGAGTPAPQLAGAWRYTCRWVKRNGAPPYAGLGDWATPGGAAAGHLPPPAPALHY